MEVTQVVYACLFLLVVHILVKWRFDPLRGVPTVGGPSLPLFSYFTALNFALHPEEVLQRGYDKYSVFKVALPNRWLVVVSGSEGIEDIRRRPDHELSIQAGSSELLQTEYIMPGTDLHTNRWHVDIIKLRMSDDLPTILANLMDELPLAMEDSFVVTDGWTPVDVLPALYNVVARLTSRIIVGPPLCRNQTYLDLAIRFTVARVKAASIMKMIPRMFRRLAARFVVKTHTMVLEGMTFIAPLMKERKANMERFGSDWPDKPRDFLQWYIEEAMDRKTSDEAVAGRLFLTNFAAIHTSSLSTTTAVHNLITHPEYIEPLRADVEEVVAADGWTNTAFDKMYKVDSFLRESQRLDTVARLATTRMAMQDLVLANGAFIPKGTSVTAAAAPTHRDEKYYPNAAVFDPYRFSRPREESGYNPGQAFTSTSSKWLAFGHGKHSCPGRFFAADELKAILGYILVNYDFKACPNGAGVGSGGEKGKVMFRKRQSN